MGTPGDQPPWATPDPAPSSDGTTVQPEDTASTVTRRQEEDPTTASYPTATDTKTDEDPALTQGSSSADVPPASPDVVIKDSLDKDEASVTKIAVNQIEDGSRQPDEERLPGVKVKLVDALGRVITKTDGSKAETMTDENGRWSISKIPAGANYKVRFTPDDDHDWVLNTVTLKRAADVPVDKKSDADAVDTLGRMNSAEISLAAFPTVDKMTSSRYVDPYEDVGLKYANFVQRAAPNTGGRDLIILGATTTVFIILAVVAAIFVKRHDKRHETADPQDHRENSSAK